MAAPRTFSGWNMPLGSASPPSFHLSFSRADLLWHVYGAWSGFDINLHILWSRSGIPVCRRDLDRVLSGALALLPMAQPRALLSMPNSLLRVPERSGNLWPAEGIDRR